MQKQEEGADSLVSPSFNSYSTDKLAGIADRVSQEQFHGQNDAATCPDDNGFEFVTFRKAADGVFFDGSVGPVFPIFNRDLLAEDQTLAQDPARDQDAIALQFSTTKLLIDNEDQQRDRDLPSSSSSEADDLEAIPPGTYCVWTPNSAKASPGRCKKSNSTGSSSSSSKKWKLLDLLRRSNSEGKESFVFLTPSSGSAKKKEAKAENWKEQWSGGSRESNKVAGKQKAKGSGVGEKKVSAHEAFYVRNRELKKVDKRKSYLPYRQDLVGFFASLNGMGKALPPF